jgi:nitrous-oxide reductase
MTRKKKSTLGRVLLLVVSSLAVLGLIAAACSDDDAGGGGAAGLSSSAEDIAKDRGLSEDDVTAALMTYQPSGKYDTHIMFASGGHSGQMHVIGIPSMRILKNIAVFTPEPWQGYGYGEEGQMEMLASGNYGDQELTWGDTHHPALSESGGKYDGQFLFINDKANARQAVLNLKDFETKQIVKNPLVTSDHGGSFVTPDTDWVVEGGQYAQPLGGEWAPVDQYEEKYRGMITFWKFDREAGKIDQTQSFAMELPPYWQDLCDAGKLDSAGWVVCNSFNTELATGKAPDGSGEYFEAGASANDKDFLHVINLNKAAELYEAGKAQQVAGFPVIPLQTSIDEGLLHLVPEPKSPHGADVTPDGKYVVVGGKLDPHVSIYSWKKMLAAIEGGEFAETDSYGVPVIDFDTALEAQVELGLGPLHTQFDNQGYAYTSLFLDSQVVRWQLGEEGKPDTWKRVSDVDVQYNIGHLAAAEGDTVEPSGKYLVALNKWSIDRFNNVGPLLPQNLQLVDISGKGDSMRVLYDLPLGIGEPHYAVIIPADKLEPYEVYPEVGFNPSTMSVDPEAPNVNEEGKCNNCGVTRDGNNVTVNMTLIRSHFEPERVELREGDNVTWNLTNLETARDATHAFNIAGYNINGSLEPGETSTFKFTANHPGVFSYYCMEFCSALHLEMTGYMTVEPSGSTG